jgi:hypothetical protein
MSSIKEDLKENIKKYIQYDDYINKINEKLKPLVQKKNKLHKDILFMIKSNNIPKLKVDLPDSVLEYEVNERPQAINQNYVKQSIMNYYMLDANATNINKRKLKAERLINYIMDNREIKISTKLERKKIL